MGLTTVYKEEIHNALVAARMAVNRAGARREYLEGYCAALDVIAATFGLESVTTGGDGRQWRDAAGRGDTLTPRWQLSDGQGGRARDATVDGRANECW